MTEKNIFTKSAEGKRLLENAVKDIPLPLWGPYLSERQWGTVREDYSAEGEPWQYFPHDHARSRTYLWGEDGIAGISDYGQNLCFSLALWNGKDAILKERLFGLSNSEGNHGEDVKELYYYLDNMPTHAYMKYLYKYPHAAFPYEQLLEENKKLGKNDEEYEILNTGIFNDGAYFDVFVEYAKNGDSDISIKITVKNRGVAPAAITVLPTLWFYDRWHYGGLVERPQLQRVDGSTVKVTHERVGEYFFYMQEKSDILFTENETNSERLFNKPNATKYVKDAFHEAVISGKDYAELSKLDCGTKACAVYPTHLAAGGEKVYYFRLSSQELAAPFERNPEAIFEERKGEADEFYNTIIPTAHAEEVKNIERQAYAGLLWNRQFYHYDVQRWLHHDDGITPLSEERLQGRNSHWKYLKNQDVMLMPDKWEYPWYASWDTAFQCIAMGAIDPSFAKHQLILLTREWFMDPAGQIPAYEWDFSDLNPPVHAFAALKIYKREKEMKGEGDLNFLQRIFQKLVINFTWWVNKTDADGDNVFEGGFLGLDNIGVFNRNAHIPEEAMLDQADGTSWVGMYALNLMEIAVELALHNIAFQDSATKFYQHFIIIAEALNSLGLWNEEDQFFYDVLTLKDQESIPIKVRSAIGIAPIYDVAIMNKECLQAMPDFQRRMDWFNNYRKENNLFLPNRQSSDDKNVLLSLVPEERLEAILKVLLQEDEFLAPGGIRSVSKYHQEHPFSMDIGDEHYDLHYDPADSTSNMFGGNSNWRGPVWMPVNYLIITTIRKYGSFYGDRMKLAYPTGSDQKLNLCDIADELTKKMLGMFTRDGEGNRPIYGNVNPFYQREENKDLILFYEYFHGDNSRGLGASHQTGWSAMLVDLLFKR